MLVFCLLLERGDRCVDAVNLVVSGFSSIVLRGDGVVDLDDLLKNCFPNLNLRRLSHRTGAIQSIKKSRKQKPCVETYPVRSS